MSDSAKEMARQLRSTLVRMESALSLVHDAIIWTDDQGRTIWCNGAFDRLIGKPHIEILGAKVVDILSLRQRGEPIPPEAHPARLILTEMTKIEGTYELGEHTGDDGPSETPSPRNRTVLDLRAHRRAMRQEQAIVFVLRDVTERVGAEEKLRALNAQLEAANIELEAFSYSVSHDLRTPLRAIDGFSQALLEDYFDRLDAEGKDYARRIRAAAQNMGRLIEDMLKLSRVTRAELRRERVDLSELARSIASELSLRAPDRDVEFAVQDSLLVQGDERLLRQAVENLLENAWKFTSKVPRARIEVGGAREQQETVFFVRDNGAGFDMAFADRLFGAFQRLHTSEEFPGTGIGLATVRRIARRHGGRTWAEGAVGKGATFYVALPLADIFAETEGSERGG